MRFFHETEAPKYALRLGWYHFKPEQMAQQETGVSKKQRKRTRLPIKQRDNYIFKGLI